MPQKQNLTRRQSNVLDYIRGYIEENEISPTLGEIGDALGFNRVTAFEHVHALEAKGWIRTRRHLSRSIELVDQNTATGIPIMGRISAGNPIEAVADEELFIVEEFFPRDRHCFMLRVEGDSMIGDQIQDGDYVLVESRSTAEPGQTVVALIRGEETTLKRYNPRGSLTRLEPRNPSMEAIILPSRDVAIQGVVIGVIRKY